jgi:serine/threonine-protein kinase RsbT
MAAQLGFGLADQIRLATAVSELARNVIQYAKNGSCELVDMSDSDSIRICITIEDNGPGIVNLDLAMKDGYSTSNGLGAGLPGTRRLMDSFSIESVPGLTRIRIMLAKDRNREKLK